MEKRYVKELINDWIKYCAQYNTSEQAVEYGNRVLREYSNGHITSIEAVRMIVDTYPWELESGEYKNRFNKW